MADTEIVRAMRDAFEAGWVARDRALPHVGSPAGYAAEPINLTIVHDQACCASRGCHPVCSHLCGTDLHICDGTDHAHDPELRRIGELLDDAIATSEI